MTDARDDLTEIEALARAAEASEALCETALGYARLSPARTLRLIERLREAERVAADDRKSADTLALMLADARAQRDTWRITCERMVEEPDQLAATLTRVKALAAALAEAQTSLEEVHNIAKARHGAEIEDAMQAIWQVAGSAANKARALTKETGHGG